ncbi:MAG: glycosyltransferase family 2 protein [Patescibacteria group bacterium]
MISTIIVAKDNPPYLLESIDSVKKISEEIIIGNLGIDEKLLKKLKNNPLIKIVNINKSVPYVELIREEMKSYAKNDYILFLDPDEILPESLTANLKLLYKKYDYISFPRKNIIFNKWIQHSRWWPDYQTRLFKKPNAIWQANIHSQPKLTGNGLKLEPDEKNAIIHNNYQSISQYIEKMNRYSKSQANENYKNSTNLTISDAIKMSISEFISRFYAEKGYEDGMHGFVLATLQMFYPFLVLIYLWELNKFNTKESGIHSKPYEFFKQGTIESYHWTNHSISSKLKSLLQKKIL